MAKNNNYVSEVSQFVSNFLKQHPEVKTKQQKSLGTWWGVKVDLDEQKGYKDSKVSLNEYPYFTYNRTKD